MANRRAMRNELARELLTQSKLFRRWYWRFRMADGLTPLLAYRDALTLRLEDRRTA